MSAERLALTMCRCRNEDCAKSLAADPDRAKKIHDHIGLTKWIAGPSERKGGPGILLKAV